MNNKKNDNYNDIRHKVIYIIEIILIILLIITLIIGSLSIVKHEKYCKNIGFDKTKSYTTNSFVCCKNVPHHSGIGFKEECSGMFKLNEIK